MSFAAPAPCSGCALTCGAQANIEPHNQITAKLCVLGGSPFWCHEGKDWKDPANHGHMSKERFRALGLKICGGWVREVQRLAAAGYFKECRMWKAACAQLGIESLELYRAESDPAEKAELLEVFKSYWLELHKWALRYGFKFDEMDEGDAGAARRLLDSELPLYLPIQGRGD